MEAEDAVRGYMGIVDIYYGTFRPLRAFWGIFTQNNKWTTFKALGNTPFQTGHAFALNCYIELGTALLAFAGFLYASWGDLSHEVKDISLLIFLGVILTFPVYAGLTANTLGGRSTIIDDMNISDPTLRAMGEMMRKKEESNDAPSPTGTDGITPLPFKREEEVVFTDVK